MKKTFSALILSSLFLTLFFCGCNSDNEATEQESGFSDEVIAVIEKSSTVTQGNFTAKTVTDDDGNLNVRYYDGNDLLVEEYVWSEDKEVSHTVMKYDENSLLQTKELISPDGQSNVVYQYNYDMVNSLSSYSEYIYADGMLDVINRYDSIGDITMHIVNSYDDRNNLIKAENFDGNGDMTSYTIREYDENNFLQKISNFNGDGSLINYETSEYENDGKKEIVRHFNSDGLLEFAHEYEYDDDGNIISLNRLYSSKENASSEQ